MTSQADPGAPVSIRDVARVAGVSHQTVSRVLNSHPSIRPATRQRVLDAMELLQFRPNRAARRLASGRGSMLGVLAAVDGPYYGPTSVIGAIEDAAREAGYSVLVTSPRGGGDEHLAEALEHLVLEGVDGIVMLAPQGRAAAAAETVRVRVPLVVVQADPGLSVDNEAGGALAARHLLDLGHRRLALLSGPADWTEARARRRGFEAELAADGLAPVGVAEGEWTADSGYAAFAALRREAFTAVFCANDQMALGLLHAAADAGVPVPGRLSVVGFDDVPEARHYLPPLTTVHQDLELLGRRAMLTLLAQVEGGAAESARPLVPRLVVRASTGPIPSS